MRIGEFEVAARAADPERELDTFLFCGQEFTVAPEVNILAIGRFQMAAGEGVDSNDPDALPLLIQTIASCVVEEDENRFLNLATRRRADPDLLLKIVQAVIESQTGFPTEPPVDSSPGLSTTGASSKALSSSVPIWWRRRTLRTVRVCRRTGWRRLSRRTFGSCRPVVRWMSG
jgi:hypothetical protein